MTAGADYRPLTMPPCNLSGGPLVQCQILGPTLDKSKDAIDCYIVVRSDQGNSWSAVQWMLLTQGCGTTKRVEERVNGDSFRRLFG